MSDECTCHLDAPCGFCVDLTEDEFEAFQSGGLDALRKYRDKREDEAAEKDGAT